MTFYHVDTEGSLNENDSLHAKSHSKEHGHNAFAGGNSAFPETISPWGKKKLWRNLDEKEVEADPDICKSIVLEWIFELYRRDIRTEAPSRFQCLFVCETEEEAIEVFENDKSKSPHGKIYEIETDKAYGPFDSKWVGGTKVPALICYRAEKYWNQVPSISPDGEIGRREYLVPFSCQVGELVNELEKDVEEEADTVDRTGQNPEETGGSMVSQSDDEDQSRDNLPF